MKKALVLGGGGTKGIYECGAVRALRELGKDDWDIITGTSAGALNGVLLVQGDFDALENLYDNLKREQFVKGYLPEHISLTGLLKDRKQLLPALSVYLKNEGVDISPFKELLGKCYDPERFFASDIDFGCVAAVRTSNTPVYVTKEMMRENGLDWLVASASAYPVFPTQSIDSIEYVDGGYADNCPIDFALRLGAEEVTAIETHSKPLHSGYIGRKGITIIHPSDELYGMFDFDHDKMQQAKKKGYLDTMKAYGIYAGLKYAFKPFGLPAGYAGWYRRVMLLEAQSRAEGGRWTSETPVMDALVESSGCRFLDYTQMFFASVDVLMTIAGMEEEKVWGWEEASRELREYFAGASIETTGAFDKVRPLIGKTERVTHFLKELRGGTEEGEEETSKVGQYPFMEALAEFLRSVIG